MMVWKSSGLQHVFCDNSHFFIHVKFALVQIFNFVVISVYLKLLFPIVFTG